MSKPQISEYSIIQYVPNPITGERINIGVLVFDDSIVRVAFLSRWDRVRYFGNSEDMGFLKSFAKQMEQVAQQNLLFPGDIVSESYSLSNHDRLITVARSWANSIQLTEPCRSFADVDELLDDVTDTYLLDPVPVDTGVRDRQAAAKLTKTKVRQVLERYWDPDKAKDLLISDARIRGSRNEHKFDLAVKLDKTALVAHSISFEVNTRETLAGALAWMISDVRETQPDFPLVVLVLTPKENLPKYRKLNRACEKAIYTYRDMGAEVLHEEQLEPWTNQRFKALAN